MGHRAQALYSAGYIDVVRPRSTYKCSLTLAQRCGFVSHCLCLALAIAAPVIAQSAPSISVTGTPQPLTLTAADLGTMPRATVTTTTTASRPTYEGVWLSDVLKKAGVPLGAGMRGAALSALRRRLGLRRISGRVLARRSSIPT